MGLGLPSAVLLRNGVTEVRSLKLQFEEGTPCDIVEGTMRYIYIFICIYICIYIYIYVYIYIYI
jgi:hypothetical protein